MGPTLMPRGRADMHIITTEPQCMLASSAGLSAATSGFQTFHARCSACDASPACKRTSGRARLAPLILIATLILLVAISRFNLHLHAARRGGCRVCSAAAVAWPAGVEIGTWVQCVTCLKWRRMPPRIKFNDPIFDDEWSVHPPPPTPPPPRGGGGGGGVYHQYHAPLGCICYT